jgi:hypothetical protein
VLNRFAPLANLNVARIKRMYIREAENADVTPLADIIDIFAAFGATIVTVGYTIGVFA